ncbi:hypothetical protein HCA58_22570 [Micromonospora sp. HNM0581]|nr:hypothetical protein [Micromonospora sp. HNM0581]NLU81078.1 hypothetical protein [Micromonospora sp. HNM0581]
MSLAGAYALGYGTLGLAQFEDNGPDWYDLLDPLDTLFLGTAFPKLFASMYEFANARDRWLELLQGTVHGKGIEDFVRLSVRTSDEFGRPIDDGELMLVIAGRVEDARLDQRKLPRTLLPEAALAGSRIAAGPSTRAVLPDALPAADELVDQFWRSTESDLAVEHDGTAVDALREGVWLLRRSGLNAADEAGVLLPALYMTLVARDDEVLQEMPERAEAWAQGLADDSPLIPVVDTIRHATEQGLTSSQILARLYGLPAFTSAVRTADRDWHSSPGLALPPIAFRLGFAEVNTRDHKVLRLGEGAAALLRVQRQRFEERFGRPPAPDEPLFFDPDSDSDQPVAVNPVDLERATVAKLEALDISPAWIYATQHTDGLLPALDGSFRSDSDRREWDNAVARYLSTHPGTVVDTTEQLRKLRIGAAVTSLHMATTDPNYATSLIERLPDAATSDYSDASLVRAVLQGMAGALLDRLTTSDSVMGKAQEFARAWAGADLAAAVEQAASDGVHNDPAVLLAAFAANDAFTGDGEADEADFDLEADDICEQMVAVLLEYDQPDIPLDIITSLTQLQDADEGGRLIALLIGRAMGYLVNMRDNGVTADQITEAVNWLGSGYGAACAGPAAIISALAGHPEGQAALADRVGVQEPTFNDLSDLLGIHLFPAMIWLCAGLVATTGDTNIAWLRKFRVGR